MAGEVVLVENGRYRSHYLFMTRRSKGDETWPCTTQRHARGSGGRGGGKRSGHTGDERQAVGLVQAILHGQSQLVVSGRFQGAGEQRQTAGVENGILTADVAGQGSAGIFGEQLKIGRDDDHALGRNGQGFDVNLFAMHDAEDEAAKQGGGDVVWVAFFGGGRVEQLGLGKGVVQQCIGSEQPGEYGR